MAKKKRSKKARGESERLEYKFRYIIDKARFKTQDDARRAVQMARDQFLADGSEIDGVHVIASWRNPDNRNPLHANWKTSEDQGQSLEDVFKTLHGARGALRGLASTVVRTPVIAQREERRALRSSAMKTYHQKVKQLQRAGWTYARARKEYRRKFKKHGR